MSNAELLYNAAQHAAYDRLPVALPHVNTELFVDAVTNDRPLSVNTLTVECLLAKYYI